MIEPLPRLLSGLVVGVAFGVLLQKGQVAKYAVIVRQLLLRDFTVAKIMGTAVVLGGLGVYAAVTLGHAELHVKPFVVFGVLLGGLFFGVGMALLGYCPGTAVAACGEGRVDAMVGVLGGLLGAAVYVVGYAPVHELATARDLGKLTLPGVTGVPAIAWLLGALVVGATAIVSRRRRKRRRPSVPSGHYPVR